MSLQEHYQAASAALAPDGIPLHFGDLEAEYRAALSEGVVLDRSHEGRLLLTGEDRLDLLNRISTNDMVNMVPGEGRATVFTNANARIIDRAVVYARDGEATILLTGPGRGPALLAYLRNNIFFRDRVQVADLGATHHLFALHGPQVDGLLPGADSVPPLGCISNTIGGVAVLAARMKPFSGSHWSLLVPVEAAETLWSVLAEQVRPSGGLVYNALRIRAGRPGVGFELTGDYIPLELGLWDEVSFNKGCYTGQEIIARMESRNRLARTLVSLDLDAPVDAGTELYGQGKRAGKITSSVVAPDGGLHAMAVVKTGVAEPGTTLTVAAADGPTTRIKARLGVQP
jgi:tRNA-modifying protein YgfZ